MKKIISFLFITFCLFSTTKAFSQCIVSGEKLKGSPRTYQDLSEMRKDKELLIKAAKKKPLRLEIPVGSNFRNEHILKEIAGTNFFYPCSVIVLRHSEGGRNIPVAHVINYIPTSDLSKCVKLSEKNVLIFKISYLNNREGLTIFKGDAGFVMESTSGLVSEAELYVFEQEQKRKNDEQQRERSANSRNGYGSVTDEEREKIISAIENGKAECEKMLNESREKWIKKREAELEAEIKKANEQAVKKNYVYALYSLRKVHDALKENSPEEDEIVQNWNTTLKDGVLGLNIYAGNFTERDYENSQYSKYQLKVEKADASTSKYMEILSAIKSGNPWLGDFDDFSRYDGWKDLLANAEKFFSEYPPIFIHIYKPEKKSADMKSKTYTYKIDVSNHPSGFYSDFLSCVKTGLSKVRTADWSEIPENWPELSIFDDHTVSSELLGKPYKNRKTFLIRDIPMVETYYSLAELEKALQSGFKDERDKIHQVHEAAKQADLYYMYDSAYYQGRKLGTEQEISKLYANAEKLEKQLNSEITKMRNTGATQGTTGLQPACFFEQGLYDIKLNLIDENGKILLQGGRKLLNDNWEYEFSGISSEIAKLIEDKKVKIEIDSLYLNYGAFESKAYSTENRAFVKNLPDVKIDLKKVDIDYD